VAVYQPQCDLASVKRSCPRAFSKSFYVTLRERSPATEGSRAPS
jgi:hypothetical protein